MFVERSDHDRNSPPAKLKPTHELYFALYSQTIKKCPCPEKRQGQNTILVIIKTKKYYLDFSTGAVLNSGPPEPPGPPVFTPSLGPPTLGLRSLFAPSPGFWNP
jgi:hypothetical protein